MASMLYAMGRWIVRARALVLIGWIVLLAVVGALGLALSTGTSNSFSIPGTESQEALDSLSHTFPQTSGAAAQLVVVAPEGAKLTDADVRGPVDDAVAALQQDPGVAAVTSPFDKAGGLVSDDGRAGIVSIQMSQQQTEVTDAQKSALQKDADALQKALPSGADSVLGGSLFGTSVPAISATEGVGLIVAVVVLFITFGSVLAAGMPLLSAVIGVGVSISLILLSTLFGQVSSTTPLLTVMLGLAVGIDYALFIISRHLEQMRRGMAATESIARAVATAGSAVVFAGLTVVIALLGLSVARIPFLTTMGVGAALGVAVAVITSLTLVPALLAFAGDRFAPKPKRRRPRATGAAAAPVRGSAQATGLDADPAPADLRPNRFFLGWVRAATRWPVVTIVVTAGVLVLAALPALSLRLDLGDAGQLPKDNQARQAYDLVSDHFGPGFNGPLIVTGSIVASDDPVGLMNDIADEIRGLPDVASVPLATPNETGETGILQVIPKSGPSSEATAELVHRIRGLHGHFASEYGVSLSVTGFTALGIDVSSLLGGALLPFGALVVGLSLILLAMVFRSIAIPIKATVGYLFSVIAALGAVSAVFVHGVLAGPLNVATTGPVISFMPIILMGVLFGLAMDYEVFLVSRMREEYVHRRDARAAIEHGFLGSAKVVTAAAIIMFAVFAAFVPDGDNTIKPIAVGLAVGVFVDAFIVRMTLVPAVLALLGDRAWRLPRWLDRLLPSFDVEGEGLAHELALADWPEPGSTLAIAASGIALGDPGRRVFCDVSVAVGRGETAVLTAADPAAARALALALSGRARIDAGTLKVLGFALPERARAVRRRSGYLDVSDGAALAVRLAAVVRPGLELLVIDGIDHLTDPDGERMLRGALARLASAAPGGTPVTVLAVSTEPERAERLLPGAAPAGILHALDPDALAGTIAPAALGTIDNPTVEALA